MCSKRRCASFGSRARARPYSALGPEGVGVSVTSRMPTLRSGREPGTKILREAGNGRMASADSVEVGCRKSLGLALMMTTSLKLIVGMSGGAKLRRLQEAFLRRD